MIFLIFHGPRSMIGFILGVPSNFARPYHRTDGQVSKEAVVLRQWEV